MENTVIPEGSLPVKPIIWKYVGKTRNDQPLTGEITAQNEADAMEIVRRMGVISPKIIANSEGLPVSISQTSTIIPMTMVQESVPALAPSEQEEQTLSIPKQIGKMASAVENTIKPATKRRRESIFFGDFETVKRKSERAFSELFGRTKQVVMQADGHGKIQVLMVIEHDEWEDSDENEKN